MESLEGSYEGMVCRRCGQEGSPPIPKRIGFPSPFKDRILKDICETCWGEWEGVEVKVINEYRLNFFDPQHREMLRRACAEFLKLEDAP
jgi:Fe-S cluster biosynthesis and repair protein YggX